MREWTGVYRSLEETMNALWVSQCSSAPEVKELLKLFTEISGNEDAKFKQRPCKNYPFFVLEGLDASGKTTVSKVIASKFNGVFMSTPRPQFLHLRNYFDKQPTPLRRAYYSLSNYAAAMEIAKVLESRMVILDRFWHSTAAYALAEKVKNTDELPKPGEPIYLWPADLLPRPDAVFFLRVSEAERLRRHQQRNTTNTSEEIRLAEDAKFREVLQDAFRRMQSPGVIEINADQARAKVVDDILKAMNINVS